MLRESEPEQGGVVKWNKDTFYFGSYKDNKTNGIGKFISGKTVYKGEKRGFDGNKKGYKCHIIVDTMGNLLAVYINAANIHDTKAGIFPAYSACIKNPTIQQFCADAGYRGTFVEDVKSLLTRDVDISEKIKARKWEQLKWHRVVERTFRFNSP